ncbi:hypothetical protein PR048_001590 [Dryococelus australis]|uniref:Uncharacterized protein n=1 Tax=Dryococelus australis TaxID=614101 RepID=A0ABQ9IHV5_9NEOP|nr:hypothetical protein PR048_001590 [Dryococelus australis]
MSRTESHCSSKWRRLTYSDTEPNIKRARVAFPDFDYGSGCDQPEDKEELRKKCEEFSLRLQVTKEERYNITQEMIGQSQNDKWHEMRRVRASNS